MWLDQSLKGLLHSGQQCCCWLSSSSEDESLSFKSFFRGVWLVRLASAVVGSEYLGMEISAEVVLVEDFGFELSVLDAFVVFPSSALKKFKYL